MDARRIERQEKNSYTAIGTRRPNTSAWSARGHSRGSQWGIPKTQWCVGSPRANSKFVPTMFRLAATGAIRRLANLGGSPSMTPSASTTRCSNTMTICFNAAVAETRICLAPSAPGPSLRLKVARTLPQQEAKTAEAKARGKWKPPTRSTAKEFAKSSTTGADASHLAPRTSRTCATWYSRAPVKLAAARSTTGRATLRRHTAPQSAADKARGPWTRLG